MSDLPVIPMARPVIGDAEIDAVVEVLRSGVLSLGPTGPAFERAFASYLGVDHAVAVSSGTVGLHLSLRAAGVTDGDEVITSPFSFVASSNVVVYERARPVFVDIDPVTWNITPDAAAAAVTDRTSCLLPVHIFGYPADTPGFEGLGLPIVEDACEALGAFHADGTAVGARGHAAVFGFYPNKQMTTGEGGMITVGSSETAVKLESERNQGRAPNMDWLDHDRLGFNYRLSDVLAAIGLAQVGRLDEMLASRAQIAGWYRQALTPLVSELGLGLPCEDLDGNRRGWFVFVVQVPRGHDRDTVISGLRARGVSAKPYLPAIHLMSYYRETFGHREGEFPVCEDIAARSLAVPFFPGLRQDEVERVAEALRSVLTGT